MALGLEAKIEQERNRLTRVGECCTIIRFKDQLTAINYYDGHEPNNMINQIDVTKIVTIKYSQKLKTGIIHEWFVPIDERYD